MKTAGAPHSEKELERHTSDDDETLPDHRYGVKGYFPIILYEARTVRNMPRTIPAAKALSPFIAIRSNALKRDTVGIYQHCDEVHLAH
jgi:hypothetical protein